MSCEEVVGTEGFFLISRRVRRARGGSSVELTQRNNLEGVEEGAEEFCRTLAEEIIWREGGGGRGGVLYNSRRGNIYLERRGESGEDFVVLK